LRFRIEKTNKKKSVQKEKDLEVSERTENQSPMRRVNCKTTSIETDQALEKRGSGKEAKQVPIWKQTREVVCDLRRKLSEVNEDKVLVDKKAFDLLLNRSAECLDALFPPEEEEITEMDKHGNENRRERLERLFGPYMKTFFQLSKGIYEAKTKKPLCSSHGMNPYHDADGEFSTKEDAKSWSVRQGYHKKGCRKGQRQQNPDRWVKGGVPCGRLKADNPNRKAKNKCKGTNEQVIQEVYDRWAELVEHQTK
jgi:hypothetical protein